MKIEFNNNGNNEKNTSKGHAFKGDFRAMMEERQKQLPDFEKTIQEQLKNYGGEMVALIRIHEDENGDPASSSVFVGGVASFESSMKMLQALDEAKDGITTQMAKNVADNPEMLGNILGDMLGNIIKKNRK